MKIAYVELKVAFDSVNLEALWLLLLSIVLPQKLVDLFKALYTHTHSAVSELMPSDWFLIGSAERHGSHSCKEEIRSYHTALSFSTFNNKKASIR